MRYYKKITIWGNIDRTIKLVNFRNLVVEYFNNIEYEYMGFEITENDKAREIRPKINIIIEEIHSIILASGLSTILIYTPPPAIGGYIRNIDLIQNIFMLHHWQIKPNELTDKIERSIGIYENDKKHALLRMFNPFYWIGQIIDLIVDIPFSIIGKLGFNQYKIENSPIGKLVRGILYLITVFAALLTVIDKLGYLENFKNILSRITS